MAAGSVTSQTSSSPMNGINLRAAGHATSPRIRGPKECVGRQAFGHWTSVRSQWKIDRSADLISGFLFQFQPTNHHGGIVPHPPSTRGGSEGYGVAAEVPGRLNHPPSSVRQD